MNKVAIILSTWGSWIWLKTLGRLGKKKNHPITFDELNAMMTKSFSERPDYPMDYWSYETDDENGNPAYYHIHFRGYSKGRIIRIR